MKKLVLSVMSVFCFSTANLFAADAAQPNALASMFPLLVIFVIFYFFLIRPQQQQAKKLQQMINALKKDDKVITSGGIYGTITAVKGTIIEVKIAEGVKIQIAKSAVSTVVTEEPSEAVTPEIVK